MQVDAILRTDLREAWKYCAFYPSTYVSEITFDKTEKLITSASCAEIVLPVPLLCN